MSNIFEQYKHERGRYDGRKAIEALRALRAEPAPSFAWEETDESSRFGRILRRAEVEREGFTVELLLIEDEDGDTSAYGKVYPATHYSRCEDSHFNAFVTVGGVRVCPYCRPREAGRELYLKSYRDFHNGAPETVWYECDVTYAEQYEGYRAAKYGRAEADLMARKSIHDTWETMRKFLENEISFVGVVARVLVEGEEIAKSSVWSVDFDGEDYRYVSECAAEQEREAIGEARKQLAGKLAKALGLVSRLEELERGASEAGL